MDFISLIIILLCVAALVYALYRTSGKAIRTHKKPLDSKILILWGIFALVIGFIALAIGANTSFFFLVPVGGFVIVMGILTIWFSISTLIADVALSKGRSWSAFFLLALLISPVIMGIIVATISPLKESTETLNSNNQLFIERNPDFAKEIEKLGELRDKGLITKAEFDTKKKELLDRI